MEFQAAYHFVSGKLALAVDELQKRGVTHDDVPGLASVMSGAINARLDHAELFPINRQGEEISRLTRKLATAEQANATNKKLADEMRAKITKLKRRIEELQAQQESQSSDESDDFEETQDERRDLKMQNKDLMKKVRSLERENASIRGSSQKFDDLQKAHATLKTRYAAVSAQYKQAANGYNALADEKQKWKAGGFNAVLEAKVQRLEHEKSLSAIAGFNAGNSTDSLNAKIAQQDEQIKAFRDAFFNLRGEYVELAGYAPDTQLPDEVSRPPRACVPPVLTRTLQDAGADSGGEEHPNVDGRKRGRY